MHSQIQGQVHFSHDLGWGTLTMAGLTWSICPHKEEPGEEHRQEWSLEEGIGPQLMNPQEGGLVL